MPKYETVVRADFDADESFKKAYKVIMKYLKKNEADGKMAMVSLARALGGTLMLTTVEEERGHGTCYGYHANVSDLC